MFDLLELLKAFGIVVFVILPFDLCVLFVLLKYVYPFFNKMLR